MASVVLIPWAVKIIPIAALLTGCVANSESVDNDFSCLDTSELVAPHSGFAASGRVQREIGGEGVSAVIEIRSVVDDALLGVASSDHTEPPGSYSMPIDANEAVTIAYRKASAPGFLDAYAYDPGPLTEHTQVHLIATGEDIETLSRSHGLEPDLAAGTVVIGVFDCKGVPVRGASVAVPGARRVVYMNYHTQFDAELDTTSGDSAVLALGVPPGPLDVEIRVGDVTFRRWPIESRAGALVTSWRRP